MRSMFTNSGFHGDMNGWDTRNVIHMY
jgi:hypothetical protein